MRSPSIEVDKNGKRVLLRLSRAIYLKRAVLLACSAFGEGCFVRLDANPEHFLVELTPKDGSIELELLGREFFNYTLGLMQNAP